MRKTRGAGMTVRALVTSPVRAGGWRVTSSTSTSASASASLTSLVVAVAVAGAFAPSGGSGEDASVCACVCACESGDGEGNGDGPSGGKGDCGSIGGKRDAMPPCGAAAETKGRAEALTRWRESEWECVRCGSVGVELAL